MWAMAISYEMFVFAEWCVTIWKILRTVLDNLCVDVLAWIYLKQVLLMVLLIQEHTRS